jgi:putative flavoprotein involved in K+ transport
VLTNNDALDVLVIGAGQAGLAMGYQLRQTGLRYQIVDRHDRVGESWRRRFDSLTLFTPRAYSALPGLPVPGDPDGYPTKDEIADYLESYARHFDLPIALGAGVERLERQDGLFTATLTTGQVVTARAVVVATGAFQQPAVPALAEELAADVAQLTPETYRNPQQTPAGTVLVVGDGATGRQIARELSATRRVVLATGRPRRISPDRVLGNPIFWWLDKLGVLRKSRETRIGRKLMQVDSFPGTDVADDRLRERGVTIVGRLTAAAGRSVTFASGETADVDAVIWAIGYRDQSDWLALPDAKNASGTFVQRRGLSPEPNLLFVGRSWQWTRGSALLTGVGADAAYLADHLVRALGSPQVEAPTPGTSGVQQRPQVAAFDPVS